MIVKMKKVFVVTRAASRDASLDALRQLGVMHLEPVDPTGAVAPEELTNRLAAVRQANQAVAAVTPTGEAPDMDAQDAADEILTIFRRTHENRNRLTALHRQAERLRIWGDLRREQLDALAEAGVPVKFYSVPVKQLSEVAAECVAPLGSLPAKRVLVGLVQREGEPTLPEEAVEIAPPERDLPGIRAEAGQVDKAMADDADRLAQLANLTDVMERRGEELAAEVEYAKALSGGMNGGALFAVQGWVPAEQAGALAAGLAERGITAAVDNREPAEGEAPPTLIQYPRWARPIKGLFDILGTLPGYEEIDLSHFFMIALPLFAGMLIGDAGYGLIFLLLPMIFYRKLIAKAGKVKIHLLMSFGVATLIWGVLTANYFGVSPETIANAGGYTKIIDGKTEADCLAMLAADGGWASVGKAIVAIGPIWNADPELIQQMLIKISFIIGALHLTLAHLRHALMLAPNIRALAQIGWAVFEWGMLGVIWQLFFIGIDKPWNLLTFVLLGVGFIMALFFTHPSRNPAKMIGTGLASSLLPIIGTFSDTMSYIRLMAVGLASYYIAVAFNTLAYQLAQVATWFAAVPILLFGHSLNIGLAMIAIFAHGVRLNMLEFSSNAGVQWAGYPYEPFRKIQVQEN